MYCFSYCALAPLRKGFPMAVIELTADTFNDAVLPGQTVIVDFWAPWCGPCRMMAPAYEKAAADLQAEIDG